MEASVEISESDRLFKLAHPIKITADKFAVDFLTMTASYGDENQYEQLTLRLDKEGQPKSYTYKNNKGWRVFLPKTSTCKF